MPPKTKRTPAAANADVQEPKPKRQQKAKAPAQKDAKTPKPTRVKSLAAKAASTPPIPPSLIPQGHQKRSPLNFSTPNPTFVTVYAGALPNTQVFVLHKSAITHYSPVFAKILSSALPSNPTNVANAATTTRILATSQAPKAATADPGSIPSRNSSTILSTPITLSTTQITMEAIHLPTVSASVFGLFTNWLYFQELPPPTPPDQLPDPLELTELWIFGSTYLIPSLQNTAILPLIYLLSHHDLIFGNLEGLGDFRMSKLKTFCDLAYSESIVIGRDEVQRGDRKRQLKQLAVDSVLRYIAKGIAVADWVPDFPKAMVVDFTTEMVRCVEGLPKLAKGVIGSRDKSYLVGVNEEKGDALRPQSGQQAEQARNRNTSADGGDMAMNKEGERSQTRNISRKHSDNRADERREDSSAMGTGNPDKLQAGSSGTQKDERNAVAKQQNAEV
ncbi:uncharacterized protein BP5553_02138 [Venustampulla echinocandica]|uniref:BTB domain-containing protein n=1 Tax=Venustampulla echinocandica TaxID=2656787 RepID=A0A370U301_9HELO|nr:uncharacterized protein BP5553_02138 [Venustampulla echinocandica]RDL42159.1 hypothetical protein BP5553_02138 [Venustampulla echinocandica]